jgi:drug/metabolite transporter (DMT)-like permease
MEWVFFTLAAVFFWSICNILDKYVLEKYIKKPMMMLTLFPIFSLIFAYLVSIFQPG